MPVPDFSNLVPVFREFIKDEVPDESAPVVHEKRPEGRSPQGIQDLGPGWVPTRMIRFKT
jgi:hypothetical protein